MAATLVLFCRFSADNLVEVAAVSFGSLLLIQESQVTLVELFKPLVPRNLLEAFFAAVPGEIQSEDTDVAFIPCAFYA
jgi:hypothetical protein